jgi:hypothetical protein
VTVPTTALSTDSPVRTATRYGLLLAQTALLDGQRKCAHRLGGEPGVRKQLSGTIWRRTPLFRFVNHHYSRLSRPVREYLFPVGTSMLWRTADGGPFFPNQSRVLWWIARLDFEPAGDFPSKISSVSASDFSSHTLPKLRNGSVSKSFTRTSETARCRLEDSGGYLVPLA